MHTSSNPSSDIYVARHAPVYAVIDVETTGIDPAVDTVVEIGACLYQNGVLLDRFESFVHPERAIPASASGIHHIRDRDVIGAPNRRDVIAELLVFLGSASLYVAHNAAFDSAFLPELQGRPWLCTYRLARHLWPNADNHKNQTLRYYLNVDDPDLRGLTDHRALADALVTGAVLRSALTELRRRFGQRTLQWLLRFARAPIEVRTMPRGSAAKKGKVWAELSDRDLWYWLGREDVDSDLRWNIEQELYVRLCEERSRLRRAS